MVIRRSRSGSSDSSISSATFDIMAGDDAAVLDKWDEKEKQNTLQVQNDELQRELNPQKTCFHRFFNLVRIITFGSAFCMLVGQVLTFGLLQGLDPIQYILRFYVVVLCILVMLNELEWTKYIRESKVLSIWISRGFLYGFIGILGMAENDRMSTASSSHTTNSGLSGMAMNYLKAVAWMMVGCGFIYFVMGISCLQIVNNKTRANYQERMDRSKETARLTERYNNNVV